MCVFDITPFFGRDKALRQLCRMPATFFSYSSPLSINVALWGKAPLLEDFVFGQYVGPNCITALGVKVAAAGSFDGITQCICSFWLNHTASSEVLVAFISYFLVNATTTRAWWSTPSIMNKKSGVKDLVVWLVSFFLSQHTCVWYWRALLSRWLRHTNSPSPPVFLIARPQKKYEAARAHFLRRYLAVSVGVWETIRPVGR